jgi:hypothetical protein
MAGKHEIQTPPLNIPPQSKEVVPTVGMPSNHKEVTAAAPMMVTMQELLDQSPAQADWIVHDFLPVGVSLLAGPARVDKPLLANQLGLDVAAGHPFLGRFPLSRGRVLYLALAESALQVRRRARTLLHGASCPGGLYFTFRWLPFRQGGLADLEDTIASLDGLRLVIVDPVEFVQPLRADPTLSNGYRMREQRTTEMATGFFLPLNQLALRYRLAILLLHHLPEDWPSNRRDPLAGLSPTGLTPASACNLLLMPGTDPCACVLHFAGPSVPEQRLPLAFDAAQGCWCWVQGAERHP